MPEETGADFALTNAQRYSLTYSARCMRRWGWAGFWLQLALSLVSTGILFFSVAFTTTVRVPRNASCIDRILALGYPCRDVVITESWQPGVSP